MGMRKHKPAMYALMRLYAELRGKLLSYRQGEEAIHADLARVQAVMEMLEPGIDLSSIKPKFRNKANGVFPKGQAFRLALEVLGRADKPLTIAEIALAMFKAKGIAKPERQALRNLFSAIAPTLKRREGDSVRAYRDGKPTRWGIL